MLTPAHMLVIALALLMFVIGPARAADQPLIIDTPLEPPAWALLERELLRANADACREFFSKYFDDRGFLECVPRWGGDDGPDDAIENLSDWPLLHVLGASDEVLELYKKGWEGHLRQYTQARTSDVELARDGMYYREFPVMFDWLHHAEGLTPFNLQGLSDPHDSRYRDRVLRFAGFYLGDDSRAANYDRTHKLIRSMFNGSRGPLLRAATALDWAGDPIEVSGRFLPKHGERNYQEMLDHFKDYTDTVGDHPQNLLATTLALNAFMLTHDDKYKAWLIEYVDAWRERMRENGDIIPTKIGLDGMIGGPDRKWYGGVYGWGFTVTDPVTGKKAHRNQHQLGIVGFGNAFLLTGDDRYLEPWRRQINAVNSHRKSVNGQDQYPRMHGAQGWYDYTPSPYAHGAAELYYWSMNPLDRARLGNAGWLAYLEGRDPAYPERTLRDQFSVIRRKVQAMRQDPTTPDTRLADDPLGFNPATVSALVELMLGGIYPGHRAGPVHCRVRYFDPATRRAGLPADVAALVDGLTATETSLTLVNLSQTSTRSVTIQAGGYAEHRFLNGRVNHRDLPINGPYLEVSLAPGAGAQLRLETKRYAQQPTLEQPWPKR